jgi:DNA-binding response OmpR family regulator
LSTTTSRCAGFLRTFLGSRNYNALTVTNADEALRRFHAERPAAVLLDVVMPGMDGWRRSRRSRRSTKTSPSS